jgi:hypothetical protein
MRTKTIKRIKLKLKIKRMKAEIKNKTYKQL